MMEYSSDSYNSSSSTSSLQFAAAAYPHVEENRAKTSSLSSSYHSSLHAVRRLPMKPMKKPIAPLPPMKPKVYKVDSTNFKKVVQSLTSAPEFQPNPPTMQEKVPPANALRQRRLEEVAPLALDLSTALPLRSQLSAGLQYEAQNIPSNFSEWIASERKHHKFSETCGASSPLGFNFSPSSLAWCLSPLLSPRNLSLLD